MLVPVLEPAHRPTKSSGEKRDQQILGVDVTLDAKAAADIESQTPYPRFRQTEDRGGLAPHPMHDLGGRPYRHGVGPRVVGSDDAPALHRNGGVTVMVKAALQLVRRGGQRPIDVALCYR